MNIPDDACPANGKGHEDDKKGPYIVIARFLSPFVVHDTMLLAHVSRDERRVLSRQHADKSHVVARPVRATQTYTIRLVLSKLNSASRNRWLSHK